MRQLLRPMSPFFKGLPFKAEFGYTENVGKLIKAGADIDEKDERDVTALHGSAVGGH